MKWSRELKIARRSVRTAMRAVSATVGAPLKLPAAFPKATDLVDFGSFGVPVATTETVEMADFGSNPGRLRMLTYPAKSGVAENAPLIVVLHGCGQAAAAFAQATGWMALADELGLALVLPEQSGRNNGGKCFNWFQPEHTAREAGEVLSIRQMVACAVKQFGSDPKRVFVVGLSAGGAMAAALLACYPDVFAGGAVVAGLPVGAASGTTQALMRMAHPGPERPAAEWASCVKAAGPANYAGPMPRISIWHGLSDNVVDPANGDLLAVQWSAVHGLSLVPNEDNTKTVGRHRVWSKSGKPVLEQWRIAGMAHGYPIDASAGSAGPFILDVGLSSTRCIAAFWGLVRADTPAVGKPHR